MKKDQNHNKCSCGKIKYKYAKTCSECYFNTLSGRGNPNSGHKWTQKMKINLSKKLKGHIAWNKDLNKLYCIDCNKEVRGYKAKRCRKCYNIWRKNGDNNPFKNKKHTLKARLKISIFHGGDGKTLARGKYHPIEFYQIRKSIRERDNYRCAVCKKYGNEVHHIDYNVNNNESINLITLCKKHHMKTNFNRDYWYAYFTYILKEE